MAEVAKRILIVEDERPLARALELKLTRSGFQTKTVYDGAAALQAVSSEKFDLILLDLVMPKMDGFTVLEALKSHNIRIPVVVATNLSQEEDLKRVRALGAVDYFVKSDVPINAIVERIRKALGA